MAVTSKTDICNLASDLISGATINDIDTPVTADESLYARWYDHCRQKNLREHPWNFAAKRIILAASATVPEFGYQAQFPMPNDFMRLLTVESSDGVHIASENYQFEAGNLLLSTNATNGTSVNLRYVYDIEDVTKFDAMFVDYLATTIALSVAYKITESNTSVERMNQLQKQQGAMAKAISGQERPPTRIVRSKSRNARLNSSSTISHRIVF